MFLEDRKTLGNPKRYLLRACRSKAKWTFNPCGRTVGMETHEPLKPNGVEEGAGAKQRTTAASAPVGWSEEERGHVVAFFTLLDQWDRQLREKKGAA